MGSVYHAICQLSTYIPKLIMWHTNGMRAPGYWTKLVGQVTQDTWRFVWEIMEKSRVWKDFLKNMCSKDIILVSELLNFTQKLDLFGETLFFYPVANTFSQTGCQIPQVFAHICCE